MFPPQGGREKFPSARNRQPEAVSVPRRSNTALDWLLEENQPSIRYLALTQLLDRPKDDGEGQIAKAMIRRSGAPSSGSSNTETRTAVGAAGGPVGTSTRGKG